MKNILIIVLLLLLPKLTFSQIVISGKIFDKVINAPIAYINIGILNSNTGTISNKDGSFSIEVPESLIDKSLVFSAIGYAKKVIPITSFKKGEQVIIHLNEKVIDLDEVVISASSKKQKRKNYWLGNRNRNIFVQGQMYSDTTSAGGAMALLIDNPNSSLRYIKKVALFITRNTLPEFKVRVRFLEVDSENNNLPGTDIFNESIVIASTLKKGWLDFDLTAYNYQINEPSYYVMLEWILDEEDRRYISKITKEIVAANLNSMSIDTVLIDNKKVVRKDMSSRLPIPGTFFADTRTTSHLKNFKCYYRTNSFGEWKRSPAILSAKVLMTNKPVDTDNNTVNTTADLKINFESLEHSLTQWGEAFLENQYTIPGMQLSVSKKGKTIFSKGFGYADVENEKKVTKATRFRIASVTKPMTVSAVIKLASENKLNLDTSIEKYFPSFPKKKYPITTRQLAAHVSGIRDYHEINIDEVLTQEHYESAIDAVSIFKNDSLKFKPGSQFLYSTYGYQLLGAVIESVSNQTYLNYMQENIWKPLSMCSTYGDIKDSVMVDKSKFYDTRGNEAKPYDLSSSYPSGGLISTTEDLLKFGNGILGTTFLHPEVKKELFERQFLKDGTKTNYGLGWYLGEDNNNHKMWYHSGELPSSGAILIVYPDDDIVISLLTNSPILTIEPDGVPKILHEIREVMQLRK